MLLAALGLGGPPAVFEATYAPELQSSRTHACKGCCIETTHFEASGWNRTAMQGHRGRRAETISAHEALMKLYQSAGGRDWKNKSGWGSGTAPCSGGPDWFGVKCDGPDVVSLSFLPPELEGFVQFGALTDYDESIFVRVLKMLNETGNNLRGTLPTELFALSTLTEDLMLPFNYELSGTIPTETGHLSKLSGFFAIPGAKISGTLPSQVGRLSGLTKGFILSFNQLSGSIPGDIANIQKLGTSENPAMSALTLQYNRFTGAAPSGLVHMGRAWPVEMCFSMLTWVPPAMQQCEYRVRLCDELYRTPGDRPDGATAWFYDKNAQCKRCPPEARRDLILILTAFAVGAPLAFFAGKILIDPDSTPIARRVPTV